MQVHAGQVCEYLHHRYPGKEKTPGQRQVNQEARVKQVSATRRGRCVCAHVSMLPIRLQRDTDATHRPFSFNQQVESSSPWSVPLIGPPSANGEC